MADNPYDIFPKLFAPIGKGYALWNPAHDNELPVEIADVGYIENGSFIRLFNASVGPDHALNKFGVPNGHRLLRVGEILRGKPSYAVYRRKNATYVRAPDNFGMGVGDELSFGCLKKQGAVMVDGGYTEEQDALEVRYYPEYILENYQAWLEFANGVHGRNITVNDLVLVTGHDKTLKWACAILSARSKDVKLKIYDGDTALHDAFRVWASWDTLQVAETHSGPVQSSALPQRQPRPDVRQSIGHAGQSGLTYMKDAPSQCMFLRGYKLLDRTTWQRRLRLKRPPEDGFHYIELNK